MIKIELEHDALIREIDDYLRNEVPEERQQYVLDLMIRTLQSVIEFNPVDTARSRASWVACLEELGEEPPAGWEGGTPQAGAIQQGKNLGEGDHQHEQHVDELTASSHVDYINYLEFGTSHQPPAGMVRKALLEAAASVQRNS